jgi:hypothetical protein
MSPPARGRGLKLSLMGVLKKHQNRQRYDIMERKKQGDENGD